MTYIRDLASFLVSSRLALFVGADLPVSLSGLPGRAELALELAQRHGIDKQLTLASTAQRMVQGGNRFGFTDYLIRQLDTQGKEPQRFHHLVTRLPIDTIITTAYDDLLERAFQQAGIAINIIVSDSDLSFRDPRRPTLIKLYGDLAQRNTLVVTEDDHYALWRSKEELLNEVRATLRRCAMLFVGNNLADSDFNLLWREVLDRIGRFAIGAFAVSPGMPSAEQQVWAERQIRVLDVDVMVVLEQIAVNLPLSLPIPSPPSYPNTSEVDPHVRLLDAYRTNLDHLLLQASQHGGEASAPLAIANAIREQRLAIRQLKAELCTRNVRVTDRFGDEPPPTG